MSASQARHATDTRRLADPRKLTGCFTPRTALCMLLSGITIASSGGCGAILSGTTDNVVVYTQPPRAQVYVDGNRVGVSPAGTVVGSESSHVVEAAAPGYYRGTAPIETRVNAGYVVLDCALLLLFIVPGVLALVIDAASGGWSEATPRRVVVHMDAVPPPPPPPAPAQPIPLQVLPAPPSTIQPAPVAPAAPAAPGCQYDAQCKGTRICQQGTCVDPAATAPR